MLEFVSTILGILLFCTLIFTFEKLKNISTIRTRTDKIITSIGLFIIGGTLLVFGYLLGGFTIGKIVFMFGFFMTMTGFFGFIINVFNSQT
ncbi:MAG: hypothetical protein M0Z31_11570 [Clostridia bacterium]|nr:hypothetical protein [Clostridia bacterium]